MGFELYPTVNLKSDTFSILVAPSTLFTKTHNCNSNLQSFSALYVCGNYSGILSYLSRRFTKLEIRRAFTVFQLMTILEESHHSLIFVEHDPMLYENGTQMAERVSRALRDTARQATVLLYSMGIDPFLEGLAETADKVFYFEEMPRYSPKLLTKAYPKMMDQAILGGF